MKKFRACVIGVGFIGAAHIEALRRLGNVEVVALSDIPNAQAKADAFFVPKGYDDYKEMLDTEKPDVVHIMANGRIIKSGGPELALEVENNGYADLMAEVN